MAITQNTYTGNGSTVLFSFTFPYLDTTDIKVSLDGTLTTAYTLANATTIQFNTAPTNGVAIRIYRVTDDADLAATFYPGSAIRSQDLNDNFTQGLYVTQESSNNAATAITSANTAISTANAATTTANSAISLATTADGNATTALAQSATALSTANAASANAAAAVVTADGAEVTAQNALDAVNSVLPFITVANVAAIPSSPSGGDVVVVIDSTGIESFTPLTGLPGGFVGDSGIQVKIAYDAIGITWEYVSYQPNDPDGRYEQADVTILKDADIGVTVQPYDATYLVDADIGTTVQPYDATYLVDGDIDVTVQSYDADTVKQDVLPTFTTATRTTERTITAGAFDLSTGNLWTVGAITVPNPTNAVVGQTGAIRVTAGPVVWSANFKFPGGTAPTIATFPAIIPYYVEDASTILMGNVVEGIA